jgi:adenine-specific DNA methylase
MQLIKNASKEKLRGGFYTPVPIASFILKWAFNGNKELDILEPSCGDGVFLEEIQKGNYEYNSLTAIEFDEIEANIDELTQISAEQMKKVVELEPESESANFILGIIYQNRAANLFERRNNTTDNAQANEYDDMARDVLQNALTYYERAAEINPDNPDNWQSLFQVYTTLGMEEEAAEAMEKAGFEN